MGFAGEGNLRRRAPPSRKVRKTKSLLTDYSKRRATVVKQANYNDLLGSSGYIPSDALQRIEGPPIAEDTPKEQEVPAVQQVEQVVSDPECRKPQRRSRRRDNVFQLNQPVTFKLKRGYSSSALMTASCSMDVSTASAPEVTSSGIATATSKSTTKHHHRSSASTASTSEESRETAASRWSTSSGPAHCRLGSLNTAPNQSLGPSSHSQSTRSSSMDMSLNEKKLESRRLSIVATTAAEEKEDCRGRRPNSKSPKPPKRTVKSKDAMRAISPGPLAQHEAPLRRQSTCTSLTNKAKARSMSPGPALRRAQTGCPNKNAPKRSLSPKPLKRGLSTKQSLRSLIPVPEPTSLHWLKKLPNKKGKGKKGRPSFLGDTMSVQSSITGAQSTASGTNKERRRSRRNRKKMQRAESEKNTSGWSSRSWAPMNKDSSEKNEDGDDSNPNNFGASARFISGSRIRRHQ